MVDHLDFFYTFLFFCSAFIVGELLQTLAHEFEWIIDIFFKFRRPSEVFLYKNNPILKNDHKRNEMMKKLLADEEIKIFEKEYSTLSILWWKINKKNNELSQSIFWKLYSKVSSLDEIKTVNKNYLFVRVMMIEFFIIGSMLILNKNFSFGVLSIIFCLVFLWRGRGVARGLVFKTVLLNLKEQ